MVKRGLLASTISAALLLAIKQDHISIQLLTSVGSPTLPWKETMTKSARAATCAAEFLISELPRTPKFKSSRLKSNSSQLQDCPDKLVRIDGLGEVCLEASQPGQSPIFVTSCSRKGNHR
jgi:hypothetical protein